MAHSTQFDQTIDRLLVLKKQLAEVEEQSQQHNFVKWLKSYDIRLPFGHKGQSVMYAAHVKYLKLGHIPRWAKYQYCGTGFVLTTWVRSRAIELKKI
ncbi:MAG TPA: hypothetical protein V6D19_05375 [Stenomitos sp.]